MDLLSAYGPAVSESIRHTACMTTFCAGHYAVQRWVFTGGWRVCERLSLMATVACAVVLASWLLTAVWWAAPFIPPVLAVVALLVCLDELPLDNRVREARR